MTGSVGGASGPVTKFKAPLLDRILGTREDAEQRVIALDLGGPCQSLLDKLSATGPCRVEVADFARCGGLAELDKIESLADDGEALFRRLLPAPGDEPLTLIFLWDLPNYLSLAALKLLIDLLAQRVAAGCKLHMLVAYSKREIAAQPARYQPGADGNLIQTPVDNRVAEVPRHTQEALVPALGKFAYERGVLLTNGMQELVYVWPRKRRPDGRPY